jgi:hypothetical protein
VFPALVRSLGSMEAAAVVQYVAYRQADDVTPVRLRVSDFVDATGLSDTTVKRHTKALAERGVLVKHQAGRNAVVAYAVVRDHPLLRVSDRSPDGAEATSSQAGTLSSSRTKNQEHAAAGGAGMMLPIMVSATTQPPPAQSGPPKTAQTLVARWVDGYRSVNAGTDPHRAVLPRVAGHARTVAKACGEDHDAWVDAWNAVYDAGVAGSHDLVRYLVPQQQRRQSTARRNVFADRALGGPDSDTMGRFQTMLAGDTPRALGSGQ